MGSFVMVYEHTPTHTHTQSGSTRRRADGQLPQAEEVTPVTICHTHTPSQSPLVHHRQPFTPVRLPSLASVAGESIKNCPPKWWHHLCTEQRTEDDRVDLWLTSLNFDNQIITNTVHNIYIYIYTRVMTSSLCNLTPNAAWPIRRVNEIRKTHCPWPKCPKIRLVFKKKSATLNKYFCRFKVVTYVEVSLFAKFNGTRKRGRTQMQHSRDKDQLQKVNLFKFKLKTSR